MMADPSAEFADLALAHFGEVGRLLAFLTGNLAALGPPPTAYLSYLLLASLTFCSLFLQVT